MSFPPHLFNGHELSEPQELQSATSGPLVVDLELCLFTFLIAPNPALDCHHRRAGLVTNSCDNGPPPSTTERCLGSCENPINLPPACVELEPGGTECFEDRLYWSPWDVQLCLVLNHA